MSGVGGSWSFFVFFVDSLSFVMLYGQLILWTCEWTDLQMGMEYIAMSAIHTVCTRDRVGGCNTLHEWLH